MDLGWLKRTYRIVVRLGSAQRAGPFHAAAILSWQWEASLAARSATTEEDLLMELFGPGGYYLSTEPPWLRVDVTLRAAPPVDAPLPMPGAEAWRRWAAAVSDRLATLLPITSEEDEHGLIALSWRSEPEVRLRCEPDGRLLLAGVELAAWQGIELLCQWDNPDREWDADPDEQLADFAGRVRAALREWGDCLEHLISAGDEAAR